MLNKTDLFRVDLNLLMLFEVVFEQRHVARSAEVLKLSPSAISHGLKRLRELLNDPLFLKTPKGVVPTARALELAIPIVEILDRVRGVLGTAEPFDPATSSRRFTIGAPDAISAVLIPRLLTRLQNQAPGIDISIRQILPPEQGRAGARPWGQALADIETRLIDLAIVPVDEVPARFVVKTLYEEKFVIAMRRGHPFLKKATLENYCRMRHLVVSLTRDEQGFVDAALAPSGHSRHIQVAAPNFMFALALLAETDLIAALPQSLVTVYAKRFGLTSVAPPFPLRSFSIRAVTTKAAMMDAGVAWIFEQLAEQF
jgi:DNA-binding transcriptional LysR family regulator